ncbi:MAG TPA: energy-coupling factor ABC transporter permease [Clostridia bacterium]|nr:energy-coupling factor ABC transporter permease [Clostridia bacterium]
MHMADALITPLVGGVMYIAAAKAGADSIKRIKGDMDETKIPMMGVMGAFVFATQMINFTIPGTGSSGHLGGGMLLAAILGPYAGFLAMAAVLTIQALFFADGGLLALGCNIFNLGFYTCFIAYPLIYKRMLKKGCSTARITWASMLASILGLQLGAFSVVVQTILSGKIELPFSSFLLLMQSIHLAIGIVEGLVTAAVISFIWKARPELIEGAGAAGTNSFNVPLKRILLSLVIATLAIGGILSWYASSNPDGLEWSLYNSTGEEELIQTGEFHQKLSDIQNKLAILPDYSFKAGVEVPEQAGTSTSGILGSVITLLVTVCAGIIIKALTKKTTRDDTY